MKNLLSLVVLASIALSATPSFARVCTAEEKTSNKMFYSDKEKEMCCCERVKGTNKFIGNISAKGDCGTGPNDIDHIKLSGPDYCPCEFTKE